MDASNHMRAKVGRSLNFGAGRFPRNLSLGDSTPARFARLRGIAQRQVSPLPRKIEGELEHEPRPRNHIRGTYKGCEERATLGLLARNPATLKDSPQNFRALSP